MAMDGLDNRKFCRCMLSFDAPSSDGESPDAVVTILGEAMCPEDAERLFKLSLDTLMMLRRERVLNYPIVISKRKNSKGGDTHDSNNYYG